MPSVTVVCHRIRMSDVEDPDLMVADPIWRWQQTEMGQWIMNRAIPQTPRWDRTQDPGAFGWLYTISADLTPRDYTYWCLRWGHEPDSQRK